jgi:putative endonuclease
MYYVYQLKLKNGYYVGCTNNLKDRIHRHKSGQVEATKERLPLILQTYTAFVNRYVAYEFEKYLKTGSGRAFANKRFYISPTDHK